MKNIRRFVFSGVQSRSAMEFGNDYHLITNSQDIEAIIQYTGMDSTDTEGSLMVLESDGDYEEVWWSIYETPGMYTPYHLAYYHGKLLKR